MISDGHKSQSRWSPSPPPPATALGRIVTTFRKRSLVETSEYCLLINRNGCQFGISSPISRQHLSGRSNNLIKTRMNQHIDQTILSSPHFDGCPWPGDIYKMGIGLTGSTTEIQIEIWCSFSTSLGGVRVTFPFIGVLFCVHIIIIIVVFQTCRIIKTQVTLKGGVTKKCAASRSDQSF